MEKDSRWLPLESIIRPDTSSCNKFHHLNDHRHELYHENVPAKGIIKEVQQRQLFQDKGSQEDSAFQFSVSRLPKWAQVKVTTPGSFPVLLNSGFYKVLDIRSFCNFQNFHCCAFFSFFDMIL